MKAGEKSKREKKKRDMGGEKNERGKSESKRVRTKREKKDGKQD